jgi:beta-glucosidase
MTEPIQFPDGFLWGCATSAYQIEGSPLADGAGPSIWQRFLHSPSPRHAGDTGDVACDHYRRYADDVALMDSLGIGAYRFSIAWPRIFPAGKGAINPAGLDFYDRLVDALLLRGIVPLATLFHWDLPVALDDLGGWLNRDIADWFADYATAVFRRLDDRVTRWATLNEPWVVSDGGYLHGALAPGHANRFEAPIVTHNLMRAHGAAVQAYRAVGRHHIGLVVNLEPQTPASQDPADVAAANRVDAYMNRQYLDPALLGEYPPELAEIFGEAWPRWPDRDLALIRQPIDFLGVNYYTRSVRRHDPTAWPLRTATVRQPRSAYTETAWEVCPAAFTQILLWVRRRYGDMPIYITENGAAFYDPPVAEHGRIHDTLRIAYLRSHLRAAYAALAAGVDLRGYMVWSLLDNLEWSLGFTKRFGIVHVDFTTLERTPKDSARYYARVIASRGAVLAEPLDPGQPERPA